MKLATLQGKYIMWTKMGVRHPEQDRYSEHETVLCVSGKPKDVRLCELNPESMDWESGSEERVNQDRGETGRGNAGQTSGNVPPTISKTVCTEPMELEEGLKDSTNSFVHFKSVNTETGVIHPIPGNRGSASAKLPINYAEPMDYTPDVSKNFEAEVNQDRGETGRGNAGQTSGNVPPTISKTVCTEPMELEEGNVVTDNSRNWNNPFGHLKSLNKETGVIHPPVNTPSGNKPCIKISKNVSTYPMECETDTESTFKEGEVVHGNIGVMKILLPHLKSVRTETGVIDPWLIDEKKFQYAEYIGRGAFGTVYLVTVMETRKFVSKIVSEEKFNETEVSTLLNLKHESVPTLLGFIRRQQGIEILMQFSGINLEQFVESNQYLDDPKIWSIAKQLLDGLFFLSSRGIMHTDLHPRNICINEGKVQIIDYGSTQQIGDVKHCNGWTVFYAAPEFCNCILKTKDKKKFPLTGKCDVFSCALCLQYLLDKCHTLENYYNGCQDKTVGMQKLVKEPNMVVEKMVTRNGSPVMRCLLKSLLQGHPCNRLSAEEGLLKMADLEKRCANWYM